MENKQNASVVITFANGMQRKVKEDYLVVRDRIEYAEFRNRLYRDWIALGRQAGYTGPRAESGVTLTDKNTGNEFTFFLNDVSEINVTTDKVFADEEDEEDTESTRVTLVDGREIEVEEDFDTVNVRWNRAFMKADCEPPVLSLTEKDTGSRLAILAQNIEMLEEL